MLGQLKPGETLTNLLAKGAEKLDKLAKPKATKTIQVIIFVHAATDPIPEDLMVVVREASRPDVKGQRRKYTSIKILMGCQRL